MPNKKSPKHSPLISIEKHAQEFVLFSMCLVVLASVLLVFALKAEHDRGVTHYLTPAAGVAFGQSITEGSVVMKIDTKADVSGQASFPVPSGKHYISLYLTVKNISDKPIQVLPSSDTYIKDAAGNTIYLTPYGIENPFRAGELLPGDQIRGQLSYLVPSSGTLRFYVDAVWSGGVIPFAL